MVPPLRCLPWMLRCCMRWRYLCVAIVLLVLLFTLACAAVGAPHSSGGAFPASCTGYALNVVHNPSSRIACVSFLAARQAFAQGGASQEQRDRLLQTTDRLDGQSRRLEDSKRTMMEIEDTGEREKQSWGGERAIKLFLR